MAYGEGGYARVRWAGYGSSGLEPPNQILPPPVPGGSGAYYWSAWNGFYPYSYVSWAGVPPQIAQVYGGVVAVPDADTGVMNIQGWWPNATVLHFVRIHPDGSRHPVRGAYGLTVDEPTRLNLSTNPSFEAGLNGVVTDAGTPALTRINIATDPTIPLGEYAMRATVAGAGSNGVTIPTGLTGALPVTVGFDIRLSVRPTGLRVVVSWTDAGGAPLTTNTVNVSTMTINEAVGQWARVVETLTPPTNAVTPTFKIIADGVTAGSTMDLDGITIEQSSTSDGSRFDGDSLAGSWTGTEGLSTSRLAPIQTVADAEAPLDVPVTYVVANPALTGGMVTSSAIGLPSLGRWCWLTHPLRSTGPIRVDLKRVPNFEHGIEQGVFYPIGARQAVVVSTRRRTPAAELIFNAVSFAERDALLDVMSDGMPLLLRAPARYGYGTGTWWALGTVTEDREERLAYQDAMILTAQAISVREPSAALYFQEAA
jgi:hypothetical protein